MKIKDRISRRIKQLKVDRDIAEFYNETEKVKRYKFAISELENIYRKGEN